MRCYSLPVSFLLGLLFVQPVAAQPKAVAIRDSVHLFLPTDAPCVELFNSVHQSIVDNPAYRFAKKGEAALNIEFGCYVPNGLKEMEAFVFTLVTTLGRSIV